MQVSIYPNPSTGLFELSFNNYYIQKIHVYNSLGKLVQNDIINNYINNHNININNMPSGVYFVKIETKEGNTTIKAIKNSN